MRHIVDKKELNSENVMFFVKNFNIRNLGSM